jgi:hypothetical protein
MNREKGGVDHRISRKRAGRIDGNRCPSKDDSRGESRCESRCESRIRSSDETRHEQRDISS